MAPPQFVRFLQAVVRRGRQGLIAEIAQAYQDLTDRQLNRVHAGVTLARDATPKLRDDIVERLTAALGKEVRPHFRTDKTIIGTLPLGKGRVVIFGGLLPQPTEAYPHWFGLDAYTISIPGQQLLLHGLTWKRPA